MEADELLKELGYAESPCFVRAGTRPFQTAPDHGHIFRHASHEFPRLLGQQSQLLGVYTLSSKAVSGSISQVPIVYFCKTDAPENASKIHRLVWNQDVVPFVLVHTPQGVILHSGFHYERTKQHEERGVLRPLTAFNEIQDLVDDFRASSIDTGRLWKRWQPAIKPEKRVDWKLLGNLRKLDERLQSHDLHRQTCHALIGKYVFLHYLKDRAILSPRKLESWGLKKEVVFGHGMTLTGLRKCIERLDEWLNGTVFPIEWSGPRAPKHEHVQAVASTFAGDEPVGSDLWQLALDFQAYDFSYIPIETLSVIYEQFLHTPESEGKSKGRERGAYYTPIPLVNLMLTELENRRPIARGIRLLDPSCGSGAFLVQAYRRLIERECPAIGGSRPTPVRLRDLLTSHIFGIDSDADACSVTELSLLLTLLDYVEPPDLEQTATQKKFQLPSLRGENILCADLFDTSSDELTRIQSKPFDLVVGNPPWKSLNPNKLNEEDKKAYTWIQTNGGRRHSTPVGGNQVAQAFTWRINDFMTGTAEVALLIPAMTLFENRSRHFRRSLFTNYTVHRVVNFANLAEVLFAGRSRVPAAAIFFSRTRSLETNDEAGICVFSPFVANQEANRPDSDQDRSQTWSITVNESEIRQISASEVANGNSVPWKLASWGSKRDTLLLEKLERRFESLQSLEKSKLLVMSQGLELRTSNATSEGIEEVPAVIGEPELDVTKLARYRQIFRFPNDALSSMVPRTRRFARKGRVRLPLSVCRAPHVIVSAARTFAVFVDLFVVVPPRQIGIVSTTDDRVFLKALSIYLSSDFAFYHQFLTTTEFGVKRDRATLRALRRMPIPLNRLRDCPKITFTTCY